MAKPHQILLLTNDDQRRSRWLQQLGDRARITTELSPAQQEEADLPELIVTDKLPIERPLGAATRLIASGEIAVMGIGTLSTGDVVLPEDYTARELRLACHLLVEMVRLRRQLVEETRKAKSLRAMADRDPLTGLANRRKWDRDLVSRLEQLALAQPPTAMGVVLLDLDCFKPLNDQQGHLAGDTVLRRLALHLAANVAPQHLVARVGGDEFGVLLCDVLAHDIAELTESIRRTLAYRRDGTETNEPQITASAGVAILRAPCRVSVAETLAAADQALRDAKSAGGDRTVAKSFGGA